MNPEPCLCEGVIPPARSRKLAPPPPVVILVEMLEGKAYPRVMKGHIASPSDWPHLPMPSLALELEYQARFSRSEFAAISRGKVPALPDDRWFIYCLDRSLFFHRSTGGQCIYLVHFGKSWRGYFIKKAMVNRDPAQYGQISLAYDAWILHFLIRSVLLSETLPFPPAPSASPVGPPTTPSNLFAKLRS